MDKKPIGLIITLLLIFAFVIGWNNFQYNLFSSYSSTNYTNLTSVARTQEIYENIEEQYTTLNESMSKNPTTTWDYIINAPATFLTTATTVGYLFFAIPTWFQNIFTDLTTQFNIIPAWANITLLMAVMLVLVGWFIYFWTGKKAV